MPAQNTYVNTLNLKDKNTPNAISALAGKKAAYFTLGCKLNFAETSTIAQQLETVGVTTVKSGEKADICIINTCSVTEVADHKCRQTIHRLTKQHPGAFVVVIGCYAQLRPTQIAAIAGVDLVLGAEQKANLLHYLAQHLTPSSSGETKETLHEAHTTPTKDIRTFIPSCSCGNRTRYFLKVQDGCDFYCSYCTVPFARGRSRNGSITSLVQQAQQAAQKGAHEIVLTGVNIGDYGKTTHESLLDLLKALDKVDGIARYRISSIEPNLLTDEIIDFCAHSRAFMPHFHIPLQSGSDKVLKLMRRKYTTKFFAQKIERIISQMPNAFIGIDVIVGMRGETKQLFEETYHYLSSLPVAHFHVFSYSERPGTAALNIKPVVSPQEKHQRSSRLLTLSAAKLETFYNHFIGTTAKVLVEKSHSTNTVHGFTENYIKVELPNNGIADNQILHVSLDHFNHDKTALRAHII